MKCWESIDNGIKTCCRKRVVGDVLCHRVSFWIGRRSLHWLDAEHLFFCTGTRKLDAELCADALSCFCWSSPSPFGSTTARGWAGMAAPCLPCTDRLEPEWQWCESRMPSGSVFGLWDEPLPCCQGEMSAVGCICWSQDFGKVEATCIEQD